MHQSILMGKGDSYTIRLPSGREINIEITEDNTNVCYDHYCLFAEETSNVDGRWRITYPKHLINTGDR